MNDYLFEVIDARVAKLGNKIMTSVPARVLEYDKDTNEAKLAVNVELANAENSPLIACKVHFPGDDDYVVVHAIKKGTQGMAMFSHRAIKKFFETGETQTSAHQFRENDAWFVPGVNSDDKAVKNAPDEGIRMQTRDGKEYLWLKPGELEVNVPTKFTAAVTMEKGFDAKENATLDGENLTKVSHTHNFTNADGAPSVTNKANES